MLNYSRWRTVTTRSCHQSCLILLGAITLAGCVSYNRKPIVDRELVRILAARSPEDSVPRLDTSREYGFADGVSLEEAELVAIFYNPTLRVTRLQAQVPVLSAKHAGQWTNPELGVDAMRIMDEVEKPWITGASLAFTIPISGRLAVERSKADAEGRTALMEAWSAEQLILRELRDTWIDWESAGRSAAAGRDLLNQLEGVVAITSRLETAGEIIAAEGVAFRLSQARSRLDLERLETQESEARAKIIALMGLTSAASVVLVPSDPECNSTKDITQEALLARNPNVLLRVAEYEVAEQALRLEIRRQYPDIQLGPAYENEGGIDRVGFGFSVPLPILNSNKRAIVEADATREAARGRWEESVQQALEELAAGSARLDAAMRRQIVLREIITPLADSQLAEARHLAERGEINTLLLLEALGAQREMLMDRIDADAQVAHSRAALRALAPPEAEPSADVAAKGASTK
ncbi:TolC family protein [soil metagenome]